MFLTCGPATTRPSITSLAQVVTGSSGEIGGGRVRLLVARRRGEHVAFETLLVEPSVAAAQPGRVALAEMAREIDALATDQREALLLVVLEGLSYSEAASVLGIPMGTLMSRLGRARAALRTATGSGEEPRLRTVK